MWAAGVLGKGWTEPAQAIEEVTLSEFPLAQRSEHPSGRDFSGLVRDAAPALHPKNAGEVVSVLVEALQDLDVEVRKKAALALGRIGPQAADAVPSLVRALQDQSLAVRRRAALALGDIGVAASSAILALRGAAWDDSDWGVRRAAALALQSILGRQHGHICRDDKTMSTTFGQVIAVVRPVRDKSKQEWPSSP